MKGVPELLILRALADREMYGYQIARAIEDATQSHLSLGEGVIYPTLHGLERRGSVASRQAVVDGRRRVYYRITRKGRRHLQSSITEWTRIVEAVSCVIGKPAHA